MQQRSWRQSEHFFEMPGEMALIEEPYFVGNLADGKLACRQKVLRLPDSRLNQILIGRLAGRRFKQPVEMIKTYTNYLGNFINR